MPIYGICTAFLSREAAIFYRLLEKVGKALCVMVKICYNNIHEAWVLGSSLWMFPAIHGVQGRGPRRVYEDLCQCKASHLLFLAVRQNRYRRGSILASGNVLLTLRRDLRGRSVPTFGWSGTARSS
jgi:hypothetical protein